MSDLNIIEPVGTCPLSGYPLIAIHNITGFHAGLALAYLQEAEHLKQPHHGSLPPRLALNQIATTSEVLRSWTELLLLALQQHQTLDPDSAAADNGACHTLLDTRHHYDINRIVAAVHVSAVDQLRRHSLWTVPGPLMLTPDVGVAHVRTAAQAAIRRLASKSNEDALDATIDRLRRVYLQHLAAVG